MKHQILLRSIVVVLCIVVGMVVFAYLQSVEMPPEENQTATAVASLVR